MDLPIVEVVTRGNKVEAITIDGKRHEVSGLVFKDCWFEDEEGRRREIRQTGWRGDRAGYAVMTALCLLIYFSGVVFGAAVF